MKGKIEDYIYDWDDITDVPTREQQRQRIKRSLIQRETKGKDPANADSFEEQSFLLNAQDRGERAVSPIDKRPTRRGLKPIDTTEPKVPRSKQKPLAGSPPTRNEQRAFDKLRKSRLGQKLTASERKTAVCIT